MEKRGYFVLIILFLAIAILSMQVRAVTHTQVWNVTLENSTGSSWYGVVVDSDDNIIAAGVSSGSKGGIAKYNSTGTMLWEVNLTSTTLEDVITDSNKNVYAVGSNSNDDPFVLKYDTNGNHIWNISYNNGTSGKLYAATINLNQNLLVTGYDYDGVVYYPILVAYDLNANHLWNMSLPITNYFDYSVGIGIDSQNNIYLPIHATNSSFKTSTYLFKLNSTGSQLWNFSYFGGNFDSPAGIAIDTSNNAYLAISHYDSDSNITTILIKFNSTGSQVWNTTYKAPRDADPFGIVLDSNENILIALEYKEVSIRYIKYIKYDPDGQLIYNSTPYSRGGRDGPYAIDVDSNDKIYLAGRSRYNATHYNRVLVKYDDDIPSWKNFYKVGATTYLYNQSDLGTIPGLVLASSSSSVTWNQNVSVKDADLDTYASMGSGYVSFNMPYLNNTFNASANVSIDVSTCDNWIIYYVDHYVTSLNELKNEGYIVGNNMIGCSTYCANPVCANNKLNYTVTHFDGTGGEGSGSSTAVPEFSTITLILTVIITIIGFVAIRQKNK